MRDKMGDQEDRKGRPVLLVAIIVFKFVKAALFLAAGGALLFYRQESSARALLRWADWLEGASRVRLSAGLLRDLTASFELHFPAIVAACILIGIVLLCEGIFLARGYSWAPWLTILLTAFWIPFEIHSLTRHHFSIHRYVVLAVNLLIVLYLYAHRKFFRRHMDRL
jgi:hypothetical protein